MGALRPVSAVFISISDDRFEPLVIVGCGAAVAARRLRSASNQPADRASGLEHGVSGASAHKKSPSLTLKRKALGLALWKWIDIVDLCSPYPLISTVVILARCATSVSLSSILFLTSFVTHALPDSCANNRSRSAILSLCAS